MEFAVCQSDGKGRTALNMEHVAAVIDKSYDEKSSEKTLVLLSSGTEVKLATKFKTVMKKFVEEEAEEEE